MIKVVNFRNSFKYIRFFIIIFLLILCLFLLQNFTSVSATINQSSEMNAIFYTCLDDNIPGIKLANNSNSNSEKILDKLLYSELPIFNKNVLHSSISINSDSNMISELTPDTQNAELTYANGNSQTELIPNNVPNNYTNDYNGVEIKNGTNYTLTDDDLNFSSLNINKKDIIIFHTHTCESYTPSENYQYEESGNFRTTDLERSVVKVGNELNSYLTSYGYNVTHDTTYHDYPSYTGSYGRSLVTVQNLLVTHPGTDIIIDLHRDAIADTSYAPSVKIDNDTVAQLMFVIGTDGGGLEHPNWRNNLKFAVEVQQKANEIYPRFI